MDLIATGLNNWQVAATCVITKKAAKRHAGHVFAELRTHIHAEAIASWMGIRPTR